MGSAPRGSETVVIGGGIIGATTLWELSQRGSPAMLLEAGMFGQESTGKSAAVVRMHYSNPDVVRMAVRSRDAFRNAPELLGSDPVYHQVGWLFLVDEADADVARANRAMQQAEGSASIEVGLDELDGLLPGISTEGIAYALFEEESGFADPTATTRAFINAAKRGGAEAFEQSPVERIVVSDGHVAGVSCRGELIQCETVVLAAGAWSAKLAEEIGVELPMKIYREQDAIFDTGQRTPIPFSVSSQTDRIYMRPLLEERDSLLLIGRGFPKEYEAVDPDDYDHDVDSPFEKDVRARATRRVPKLHAMKLVDSRVGLYSVPPDWHPILGRVDQVEGLLIATGGSGHCFKLGPAIGELIADAITGQVSSFAEIGRFDIRRFERGKTFASTYGGNRA